MVLLAQLIQRGSKIRTRRISSDGVSAAASRRHLSFRQRACPPMAVSPFSRAHRDHLARARFDGSDRRNKSATSRSERYRPRTFLRAGQERLRRLELEQLTAAVDAAPYVIANNSGVAHLAAARGLWTLCIFSASHAYTEWMPRGPFVVTVTMALPCSPCALGGGSLSKRRRLHGRHAAVRGVLAIPLCEKCGLGRGSKACRGAMKVYYFIHVSGTDNGISGVPRVVRNLGRELVARGDVELLPVSWSGNSRRSFTPSKSCWTTSRATAVPNWRS